MVSPIEFLCLRALAHFAVEQRVGQRSTVVEQDRSLGHEENQPGHPSLRSSAAIAEQLGQGVQGPSRTLTA
jgi:hypothetical protein